MKTEHGVPIPLRAAVPLVAGWVASVAAMVAFVLDAVPHRGLWLSATVGVAVVAFAAAYLLMGETRRQTRVLRAALGYRRGSGRGPGGSTS
ncbi:hypothetical protein [Nocardioides zeae]